MIMEIQELIDKIKTISEDLQKVITAAEEEIKKEE